MCNNEYEIELLTICHQLTDAERVQLIELARSLEQAAGPPRTDRDKLTA